MENLLSIPSLENTLLIGSLMDSWKNLEDFSSLIRRIISTLSRVFNISTVQLHSTSNPNPLLPLTKKMILVFRRSLNILIRKSNQIYRKQTIWHACNSWQQTGTWFFKCCGRSNKNWECIKSKWLPYQIFCLRNALKI